MVRSTIQKYLLVILCLLLVACSGTRRLPPNEKLYTGSKVIIESSKPIDKKKKRFIKATAYDAIKPAPNKSYLGMRPKLCIYMWAAENPKTKLGKWVKKKGEAPVLISNVKVGVTASIIDAMMFNIGVFKSYTDSKTEGKNRTAKVIYTIQAHKPFTVSEVIYDIYADSISAIVQEASKKSLVKIGKDYNLDALKSERIRIDELLKNEGYFNFNPDYIVFKADTVGKYSTVQLRVQLKDSIPTTALSVYRINSVFVNQDFTLSDGSLESNPDTLQYRGIIFQGKASEMSTRPAVIARSLYLRKGDIYSRLNHTYTLNRLMSMGTFKFVQVKFSESNSTPEPSLDVNIQMTRMPNLSFRAEMDVVTKSNNFTGPRINMSLTNRNTFSGAELLYLNMAGSYEIQLGSEHENFYSYLVNPQLELIFPRFIVPFKLKSNSNYYVPKTRLTLSYSYLKRVNYFDMQTLKMGYGYQWKESIRKEHELNLVMLSFTSIGNKSIEFEELLASNIYLKKSYEEQFIGGANYSFTYNQQVMPIKRIQFYIYAAAESAGNLFSLGKIIFGEKPSQENPSKLFGSAYSQYVKLSIDTRAFYNIDHRNKVVLRLFAGVANPFGNSTVLPYTKQFFSGGANSLRAFQINSVGPGIHEQIDDNVGFLQLGGDIKLEGNAEYRFNIYRFFKGAVFVDAGNIWLQDSNSTNTGSSFTFSKFMNEIAVGVGLGVRLDVSFFLLRFDLAMPIRKPWLDENHRWVINEIDFSRSLWREKNLVLNVAIGYPF
jgi:outer membrane protein assembly factor BamA